MKPLYVSRNKGLLALYAMGASWRVRHLFDRYYWNTVKSSA